MSRLYKFELKKYTSKEINCLEKENNAYKKAPKYMQASIKTERLFITAVDSGLCHDLTFVNTNLSPTLSGDARTMMHFHARKRGTPSFSPQCQICSLPELYSAHVSTTAYNICVGKHRLDEREIEDDVRWELARRSESP